MFNPVAPYGYLLSDMYLFMQISQIQTSLFNVVGPGLISTSPAFVSSSQPAGPHGLHAQKTVNREGLTQFAPQILSAVTAPPLVGCVVWSQ